MPSINRAPNLARKLSSPNMQQGRWLCLPAFVSQRSWVLVALLVTGYLFLNARTPEVAIPPTQYVRVGVRRDGLPPLRRDNEVVLAQPKARPPDLAEEAARRANIHPREGAPGIGQFPDSRLSAEVFEDGDDGHQDFDTENLWYPQNFAQSDDSTQPNLRGVGDDKEKLLFLITGQLSRLELESKIINVFEPQMERYDIEVLLFVKVFVMMESMKLPRWPSPYELSNWENDHLKVWAINSIPEVVTDSVRVEEVSELRDGNPFVFRKIVHMHVKSRTTGKTYPWHIVLINNENDGIVVLQPSFPNDNYNQWIMAQQDTFRNFRKAMIYIEELELAQNRVFDVVFRLRDDTFAFSPFKVPFNFDRDSFGTPQCVLSSYPLGYSDHNFILGRNIASKVLRGMGEDYYFRIKQMYPFVEAHLHEVIDYIKPAKIMRIPDCYWPFFPIIYVDLGNGQFRTEFREFEIEHVWRHKCPKKWWHAPNDPNNCAWLQNDVMLHPRSPAVQAYLPLHIIDKRTIPYDVLEQLKWYGRV